MKQKLENERSLVFSYLAHRKAIGILGITFPFILSLGGLVIFNTGFQESLSAYYHTCMRDEFVGILFAIGFFLLSYKGYDIFDKVAGDLGCLFAIGLALFPTKPQYAEANDTLIGFFHLGFAILFFLTLIYFSLCLFTKSDQHPLPRKKQQRNKVFRVCGYAMAICLLLILIYFTLPAKMKLLLEAYRPVYWLEALAILFFGISWFTKGAGISMLNDEKQKTRTEKISKF